MNEMSHLRAATLDDLKAVQLEILLHVADFCKEYHIRYWLDCGTLLGAVRHKGYIPWDDDIDVGMLREDYTRFMEEFNRSNTKYRFVCIENTEDFFLPHGKVVDTDTLLFEPDINGHKLAINIDIFPYDHIPDDPKAVKRMYDWRDFWALCAEMSFSAHILPGDSLFKRAYKTVAHSLCALHSPAYYTRKCIQNARRLEHVPCSHVGNMTSFARISSPKSVFDSFVPVEFEGHQFDAPAGYDVWLTSFYGDYMQLPPEEKRVSHHSFEAYIKV